MLRSDERAWHVFGEHATRSEDDERANSAILRQCVQGSWIPAKGGCAPLDSGRPDDSTGADSQDAETYAGSGGPTARRDPELDGEFVGTQTILVA